MIDLKYLFDLLSPIMLLTALVVGIQAGAFYAYSQRLGSNIFHSSVLLGMLFASITVVRWYSGSDMWIRWVGVWVLSVVFATGIAVGHWLREWYVSRRKER